MCILTKHNVFTTGYAKSLCGRLGGLAGNATRPGIEKEVQSFHFFFTGEVSSHRGGLQTASRTQQYSDLSECIPWILPPFKCVGNWQNLRRQKISRGHLLPASKKQRLVSILLTDPTSLLPFLVYVGLGYFQHAGADVLRHGNLRYHVYLFSDDVPVHGPIIYGNN